MLGICGAVGLTEELPVDVARFVAGRVLAIAAEFNREAVIRAAVQADHEAFDDEPRQQFEVIHGGEDRRIEKARVAVGAGGGHDGFQSKSAGYCPQIGRFLQR